MPLQQVTEFRDIQVELELPGFTLPGAGDQIPLLEKATIGLLGQIADRFSEGIAGDQICELGTLLLTDKQ